MLLRIKLSELKGQQLINTVYAVRHENLIHIGILYKVENSDSASPTQPSMIGSFIPCPKSNSKVLK